MERSIEQHLLNRENPLHRGQSVVFPDYGGYCISGVPSLVASIMGQEDDSSPLAQLGQPYTDFERVVLLILDGFGYRKASALFEAFPDASLAALSQAGSLVPLTSVYPSTTVSALTSLSTGLSPLEHGMIGYRLYLRETASITNMIRFTTIGNPRPDSAFSIGLDPDALIPEATFHERMNARGVAAHAVLPNYIAHSGLSQTLYRGCTQLHSAVSLSDMFVRTRQILRSSKGKTFISLYWPGLDSVAHALGPDSESYQDEFRAVDDALRRGLVGQGGDTLIVITSDHGFVSMTPEDYILLEGEFDADRALLMPPVGEPRASYLFTRNGGKELVQRAFERPRGDGLICVDADELVESGLLGHNAPHPQVPNRIGDLALLSTGTAGTFQDYPDAVLLRGMHGGLTEDEMLVPLIIAPI